MVLPALSRTLSGSESLWAVLPRPLKDLGSLPAPAEKPFLAVRPPAGSGGRRLSRALEAPRSGGCELKARMQQRKRPPATPHSGKMQGALIWGSGWKSWLKVVGNLHLNCLTKSEQEPESLTLRGIQLASDFASSLGQGLNCTGSQVA